MGVLYAIEKSTNKWFPVTCYGSYKNIAYPTVIDLNSVRFRGQFLIIDENGNGVDVGGSSSYSGYARIYTFE